MANEAYKILRDTTIPRALALISEDEIQGKLYETEGIAYNEGDYVFPEEITPPLRDKADAGEMDWLLEPVSREEAEEGRAAAIEFVHAPEHGVEHEALVRAGKTVVSRDTVLQMRSVGAEDAQRRQEEAKAEGRDTREGNPGQFAEVADLTKVGLGEEQPSGPSIDGEKVADEETALDEQVQVTPSGVVGTNVNDDAPPTMTTGQENRAGGVAKRKKPSAKPRAKKKPAAEETSE